MSAGNELEARLVELETRVAFQEDTIATLNETVSAQAAELDALGRRMARAIADVERLRTLLYADPSTEPPPPHY